MATTDTKRTLMLAARAMVQLPGYNSLSYRELGKESEALRKWAFGIFAAIEGAQLVARGCSDVMVYDNILGAYRTTGLLP